MGGPPCLCRGVSPLFHCSGTGPGLWAFVRTGLRQACPACLKAVIPFLFVPECHPLFSPRHLILPVSHGQTSIASDSSLSLRALRHPLLYPTATDPIPALTCSPIPSSYCAPTSSSLPWAPSAHEPLGTARPTPHGRAVTLCPPLSLIRGEAPCGESDLSPCRLSDVRSYTLPTRLGLQREQVRREKLKAQHDLCRHKQSGLLSRSVCAALSFLPWPDSPSSWGLLYRPPSRRVSPSPRPFIFAPAPNIRLRIPVSVDKETEVTAQQHEARLAT